ncbi:hypothetical protein [Rhodoferax sp.]|uniref:hypothetical protein n=1 Tax=Rhodoferax sp. TaxID=50421 RepID=UPI00374CB465
MLYDFYQARLIIVISKKGLRVDAVIRLPKSAHFVYLSSSTPTMTKPQTPLWLRRTVLAGLLGGLLLAGFVVMQPFTAAIAWAAILSYVSWPLHLRVLAWLGGRRTWAALAMRVHPEYWVARALAAGAPDGAQW